MKIGDLVTLSAAGKNQNQNLMASIAKFGMIMKITDDNYRGEERRSTYACKKPLIEVKWFYSPKTYKGERKQHHWRYEIKKLKVKPKQ